MEYLKKLIRDVPDFPKVGVLFKDITPLLQDAKGLKDSIACIASYVENKKIDIVVGAEARGFILATTVAFSIGTGFVPIRKPGKLPYEKASMTYNLEYGTDTLEIHKDGIKKGQQVLMVDDLLATGGTMNACCKLVESLGGNIVGCAFLIELGFLNGRDILSKYDLFSLIKY
ncbi:MAG: adenine phosphoribosyltransferase [Candidatus Kuenenia stuttgartiensis]|jgi:adenine phosphoribosyltransferase|uniref:Adenine phosphoribosyltransferase n=1 Tax=Kuenenia stuttgartiensis TaxID=174633 RepID=Q1PZV6_KUEST|nr:MULTISPECIES: adenine phosphoribosyltransferase [Kuenenia]MBE7546613.1 adenine phosphoribosyltransferase [Planctomycetia bacterium]MBZ0192299.1 adenine phosphoribosyltransferase [Candidatus Kuenenia stuttgartiensis]MCF6151245.1 adenine phosphoribosyltransferase [Candidatus Kuenenia stuttgartiensis]MCL4726015.1 adenine phosphoribosyltransferase [Candidatus Kuenenia stuttgartiensis]MCZ7621748.1 adenine phosphoribosyltransferase [Candidatus Kuenenia sp.]